MPKKKTKTVAQYAEDVAVKLQLLVRLKASNDNGFCTCVTCGKFDHYKNMQGGHYIGRRHTSTKLLEENIHPQCPECNGFGMKFGNAKQVYTLYMIDMYGRDFVDWMVEESRKTKKWNRAELEIQMEEIKEEIKYHEKRVCGIQ